MTDPTSTEVSSEQRRREHGLHDGTILGLGIAAAVSSLFLFAAPAPSPFDLVRLGPGGAIVLAVFGIVAIVAGAAHLPALGIVAGAALVLAAVLQLVQLAFPPPLLGGGTSALALIGGLGLGTLFVSLARFRSGRAAR